MTDGDVLKDIAEGMRTVTTRKDGSVTITSTISRDSIRVLNDKLKPENTQCGEIFHHPV